MMVFTLSLPVVIGVFSMEAAASKDAVRFSLGVWTESELGIEAADETSTSVSGPCPTFAFFVSGLLIGGDVVAGVTGWTLAGLATGRLTGPAALWPSSLSVGPGTVTAVLSQDHIS